jgi:hypothetical protein
MAFLGVCMAPHNLNVECPMSRARMRRGRAHITSLFLQFLLSKRAARLGAGFPQADIGHNDLIDFRKFYLKWI